MGRLVGRFLSFLAKTHLWYLEVLYSTVTTNLVVLASYGQWHQHGPTDNNNKTGDSATDNNEIKDGNRDGATDDNCDGNGAADNNDNNDNDGNNSNSAVAGDDNVDNKDGNNVPLQVGKRNDG